MHHSSNHHVSIHHLHGIISTERTREAYRFFHKFSLVTWLLLLVGSALVMVPPLLVVLWPGDFLYDIGAVFGATVPSRQEEIAVSLCSLTMLIGSLMIGLSYELRARIKIISFLFFSMTAICASWILFTASRLASLEAYINFLR